MSSTRVLIIEFNDRRDTTMKAVLTGFLLAATLTLAGCGVAYQQQRSEILKSASAESFGPPPPADYRSIGGYTGFDPFALAWKNGKIVAYTTENTGGGLGFWQNVQ